MFVLGHPGVGVDLFVALAKIGGRGGLVAAVDADLSCAVVICVVFEAGADAVCGDQQGFVEAGPADDPAPAVGHVAVGVVLVVVAAGLDHGVRPGAVLDAAAVEVGPHVGFVGDVAEGVVAVALVDGDGAAGDAAVGEAVEAVVGELLGEPLVEILALCEVAQIVELVAEQLYAAVAAGHDGFEIALGVVVVADSLEAVAEGEAFDVAAGVYAVGLPVEGAGVGVSDLAEITLGIVDVLDAKAGGGSGGFCSAVGVIGDALGVGLPGNGGRGAAESSQVVVAVGFEITVGAGDGGQFADPLGGDVVAPGAGLGRFGTGIIRAAGHAPEFVIGYGGDLALGVGLAGEFAEDVVLVGPVPHAGIAHGDFPAQAKKGFDPLSCKKWENGRVVLNPER